MLARTLLGTAAFVMLVGGLLWPLEVLWPVRRGASWRSGAMCIVFLAGNALLLNDLVAPALHALGVALHVVDTPPAVLARVVAAVLLGDLVSYWIHRAMHRVPGLWPIHAVHHTPTHLDWVQAWRQHPVDIVLEALAVGIPGLCLGVDLSALTGWTLVRRVWTSFLHANVRWRFGWLEFVVATPVFHHGHHAATGADAAGNFAGSFPLFDIAFGTWCRPRGFPARTGLPAPRQRSVSP